MSEPKAKISVNNGPEADLDEVSEKIGHNSGDPDGCKDTGGVAGTRLKAFIERIECLNEEKSVITEDLKDLYTEAKAVGFDVKTIRKIVKLRSMDREKRAEEGQLLALYKSAIGFL